VKGVAGLGKIIGGHIDDRDFLATQWKFSDTTSDVRDGTLSYVMFDIGWAYSPTAGMRLGVFAGYHYWREKVTAYGLVCNRASVLGCPAAGALALGYNTAVGRSSPPFMLCASARGQVFVQPTLVGQRGNRRHSLRSAAERGQPSAATEFQRSRPRAQHHHDHQLRLWRRDRSFRQLRGDAEHRDRRRSAILGGGLMATSASGPTLPPATT